MREFVTRTGIAGSDVGLDICIHVGESIITRQQFQGFQETEMTGEGVIVVLTQ